MTNRSSSLSALLIQPLGYHHQAASKDISRLATILPPIGLISLAAYLERRELTSEIIDYNAFPDSDAHVCQTIRDEQPEIIGMTCTTSTFLDGLRIARLAKSVRPETVTVFGGPHVSALKERVLEDFADIDAVIVGEGEETLAELIEYGLDQAEQIDGLVFRSRTGEIRFNGYRPKALELDSLPFPAYEKLRGYPQRYILPIFNYPKAPNTSCISSRGCPYQCTYCDRSVFGRSFRYNSADYLYAHVAYLNERFGIRHITFYDDQFTLKRKRVEEFAQKMIDAPLGVTFNCVVRADHIDAELLKLLKQAGCWMISLGIETGDPDLLAQHRQNVNLDLLADKIRQIKQAGIRTKGLLMMGLPGETEDSIKKSMDYVFSLGLDDFNLAKFTPFPGSTIFENIHDLGSFDEDWEKMDCMNFLFVPHGLSRERLETLFHDFYRQHFKNPRVIAGYLSMLWQSPNSWMRFMRNFGDFIKFSRSDKRLASE